MDLVLVNQPVVNVTDSIVAGDERIAAQIKLAEELRHRVLGTIRNITTRIQSMLKDLNSYNNDIHRYIADLLSEINALREEMKLNIEEEGRKNRTPDDLDREFHKQDFEYRYSDAEQEEAVDSILEPRDENPAVVKLYRQIAGKTHPDKTDDPELHLLFLTAKQYRKLGDLKGLQEIWDFICGKISVLSSKLKQTLEELVREIAMLENQLEYLRHSSDYSLLSLYERDRDLVRKTSCQQMSEKRERLQAHLALLQRTLGKEPPKPDYSIFEFGK